MTERGFIQSEQIRSITINNVLVDKGATRLCLPGDIINQLGLPFASEIDVNNFAVAESRDEFFTQKGKGKSLRGCFEFLII